MRRAGLVAWHEYVEHAKTKGFWIGILLLPAVLLLAIQGSFWLGQRATPARYFVVADPSGDFQPLIDRSMAREHRKKILGALLRYAQDNARPTSGPGKFPAPGLQEFLSQYSDASDDALDRLEKGGGAAGFLKEIKPFLIDQAAAFREPPPTFTRIELPPDLAAANTNSISGDAIKPYLTGAKKILRDGKPVQIYAALIIPADLEKSVSAAPPKAEANSAKQTVAYWSSNLADTRLRDDLENVINSELRRRAYRAHGIDRQLIAAIERTRAPFASLNPKKEKGQEAVGTTDVMQQWLPVGFVYLLWVAVFSISQMLLNNCIEEKSNRIIEVLLSSVTPGELMAGKLAGIAAIGLTMVGAWIGTFVGVLLWKSGADSQLPGQLLSILRGSHLLPAFVLYFFLGYLLYAGLILAVGSICNTVKEAQNYMAVVTLLMMVPLLTMSFIPKDPNGTIATVLSWIPLYTPFTMMNRAAADPPWRDVIGTILLLIVSIVVVLWLCAKIFRRGILRTGQPPKLIELIEWLKSEK